MTECERLKKTYFRESIFSTESGFYIRKYKYLIQSRNKIHNVFFRFWFLIKTDLYNYCKKHFL